MVTHAGTYRYMAPEVILGEQPYSFPVDCWGLGCIGYELCTRHPVYLPPSGSLLDLLAGILNNPYDSDYLIARAKAHGLFYVSLLLLFRYAPSSPKLPLLLPLLSILSFPPQQYPSGFSHDLPTLIHGLLNRDAKSRLTLATFLSHDAVKKKAASFGIAI